MLFGWTSYGSKAAVDLDSKTDVILALGPRLNPLSTLPGYVSTYRPSGAQVIEVDISGDRIGLTKPVSVGIKGDATLVAESLSAHLSPHAGDEDRAGCEILVRESKDSWAGELASMEHEVVPDLELGELFRCDAMTAPVSVAGIRRDDMVE